MHTTAAGDRLPPPSTTTLLALLRWFNGPTARLATIKRYLGLVFDVTNVKGMQEAKVAQREVAALAGQ